MPIFMQFQINVNMSKKVSQCVIVSQIANLHRHNIHIYILLYFRRIEKKKH